jgi:hypothetical protein
MSHTFEGLVVLLKTGARGYHADEAAVALLIDHDMWLHRSDFVRTCVSIQEPVAFIDWPAAIAALDAGTLPCSTSEASILRIAAGLGAVSVDLRAMLCGLDSRNIVLVAEAVLHANGTNGTVTTPGVRPQVKGDRRHG